MSSMRLKIDINSDVGESFGNFKVGHDAEIMPYLSSANVACGFHAGDPVIMERTLKLAKRHKVKVGAHPGLPDLVGFGRRSMSLSREEVQNLVIYQVGALLAFAKAVGIDVQHVKPHGALYNAGAHDEAYAKPIVEAVHAVNPDLVLFTLAGSKMAEIAAKAGLRVAHEVFADRAYNPDGSLVSRNRAGAMVEDAAAVSRRAIMMVKERMVNTVDGQALVKFDELHTICVHGDTVNAVELVKALRKAFAAANVEVSPVSTFV